jgi:hypothetical protein
MFLLGFARILRHPGMLSLIDFKTTTPSVFRLYRSQVSFPGRMDLIAPKRAPRLTRNRFKRKTDQCLARFFVLGAVAAARALGMVPAAVLPERAGASLRRDATDPTF